MLRWSHHNRIRAFVIRWTLRPSGYSTFRDGIFNMFWKWYNLAHSFSLWLFTV